MTNNKKRTASQKVSLDDLIQGFDAISLEQLNHSMALMERKEYKYLITQDLLANLITMIKKDYKILTIENKTVFEYENVYFDDKEYDFYHQHNGGSDKRMKLRTRHYVDSEDLLFFEFKQKTNGNMKKFRYKIPENEHGVVTDDAQKFVDKLYKDIYNTDESLHFKPSLRNAYKRMTFCSKDNNERITVDYDIRFYDPNKKNNKARLENIAIIESKAASQPAPSYETFKDLGLSRQSACSKYCLGLNYLDLVSENDHFKDTLQTIKDLQKTADKHLVDAKEVDATVQASFNNAS